MDSKTIKKAVKAVAGCISVVAIQRSFADGEAPAPASQKFWVIVQAKGSALRSFAATVDGVCTCVAPEGAAKDYKCTDKQPEGSELEYACGGPLLTSASLSKFVDAYLGALGGAKGGDLDDASVKMIFTTTEACTYKSCSAGGPLLHWDAQLPCIKRCSW